MKHVTLAELQTGGLQEAEVYLARFGGVVTLRELTGPEVVAASRFATAPLPGTEGTQRTDTAKREALRIAFALVLDPPLGATLEEKAGRVKVVQNLAFIDPLLLATVADLLSGGTLTDEQREVLRGEQVPAAMLAALGQEAEGAAEFLETRAEEDLAAILTVALRGYGAALTGDLPMSTVRMLAQAAEEQETRQAQKTALALAEALGAATAGQ